jgi:Tol biopolymer transport system component
MLLKLFRPLCVLSLLASPLRLCPIAAQSLGIFEGQSDVGSVNPPGAAHYSLATGIYTITSSGADLWSTTDGFHFLWKKASGDVSLAADMDFPAKTGSHNPHRKAVLIFRQTLDADGAYADVAQHGSGLTALQFRRTKGDTTQSIELSTAAPSRVCLEKRGDTFTMFVGLQGEPLHQSGAAIKLHLDEPFYVGIGLSAHDPAGVETATFSHLDYEQLAPPAASPALAVYSTIQAIQIDPNLRRSTVVYTARARAQAPNWSRDGASLIFNQDGRLYTVPVDGKGTPQPIDVGAATACNGSHGFSPDGKSLAITCTTPGNPGNRVYIVPSAGGTPRMVTANPDSYFHSWSPDGKTILFTRPSHGAGNIYSISVDGGTEAALTTGAGISDDPDYSADGQSIYFNTDRWGGMQIARMNPDGSHVEQVTLDQFRNWTPHPSPDGKSIAFLSYNPDVTTHASDKDIALRILSTGDNKIRVLTRLIGGNGSMNVANWSPDSKGLAFVSYQMLPAEDAGSAK